MRDWRCVLNLQQPSVALGYATKAYQLRDRVSEREKLRIYGGLLSRHRRSGEGSPDVRIVDGELSPGFRSSQQPGRELWVHGAI